ncbi:MAG: hypothetical protein HQL50_07530 [Magnetococcales bacterium]|nr:hypothetical protein [Magnetococcales bacterium]
MKSETAQPQTLKDPTLYRAYGGMVLELMESGTPKPQSAIDLMPTCKEKGKPEELAEFLDPEEYERTIQAISNLKKALTQAEGSGRSSQSQTDVRIQFQAFRKSVNQSGDDTRLEQNQFHALTKEIYQLNITALRRMFEYVQDDQIGNPPPMVPLLDPHYLTPSSSIVQKGRYYSSLFLLKWKPLLELLLFLLSSLATFLFFDELPGVHPAPVEGVITNHAWVTPMHALLLTVSVLLTLIVFDFKRRWFQGMADKGKVWQGLTKAFRCNPPWMVISVMVVLFSIMTTVTALSILHDSFRSSQERVESLLEHVQGVLGDPEHHDAASPAVPTTLIQYAHSLNSTAEIAISQIQDRLLTASRKQVESRETSEMSAHYWARWFVLYGGYQPRNNSVATLVGEGGDALRYDRVLRESSVVRASSLSMVLHEVTHHCLNSIANSRVQINEYLTALKREASNKEGGLWNRLATTVMGNSRIETVEQQVTARLAESRADCRESRERFIKTLSERQSLLKNLSSQVSGPDHWQWNARAISLPELPREKRGEKGEGSEKGIVASIQALYSAFISFAGVLWGAALFALLIIAVSVMELAGPVFYGLWTAKQGVLDRKSCRNYLDEMTNWEKQFALEASRFFNSNEFRCLFPQLRAPNLLWKMEALLALIESLEPAVVHPQERSKGRRFLLWLRSLALPIRIRPMKLYLRKARAAQRLTRNYETSLPHYVQRLFDGLDFSGEIQDGVFAGVSGRLMRSSQVGMDRIVADFQHLHVEKSAVPAWHWKRLLRSCPVKNSALTPLTRLDFLSQRRLEEFRSPLDSGTLRKMREALEQTQQTSLPLLKQEYLIPLEAFKESMGGNEPAEWSPSLAEMIAQHDALTEKVRRLMDEAWKADDTLLDDPTIDISKLWQNAQFVLKDRADEDSLAYQLKTLLSSLEHASAVIRHVDPVESVADVSPTEEPVVSERIWDGVQEAVGQRTAESEQEGEEEPKRPADDEPSDETFSLTPEIEETINSFDVTRVAHLQGSNEEGETEGSSDDSVTEDQPPSLDPAHLDVSGLQESALQNQEASKESEKEPSPSYPSLLGALLTEKESVPQDGSLSSSNDSDAQEDDVQEPAPKVDTAPKTASKKSKERPSTKKKLRTWEPSSSEVQIELKTNEGQRFHAVTREIDATEVWLSLFTFQHELKQGEGGAIRLLSDIDGRWFPCSLVLVEKKTVIIRFIGKNSGQTFETLVKDEVERFKRVLDSSEALLFKGGS